MSADEMKSLLDQLSECWRKGDAQGAATLFSNNALYSEPPAHELRGNTAIAAFFRRFFASNVVVEFSFSRILIGDGEAAAEWSFIYTSTADNKRRHLDGIAFIDTVGSLIHVWRSFSGRLE